MITQLGRRQFLGVAASGLAATSLSRRGATDDSSEPQTVWHDVQGWGVEGRGFNDTEKYFDRLPARAKGVVRDAVWELSRHSAGMMAWFRTDATAISVDYAVKSARLAMPHMAATGVSGLDLYAQSDDGRLQWVAVAQPTSQHTTTQVISGLTPGERTYAMYLPLYNGTESLKIGVPEGASFSGLVPRAQPPLVFYGTSITHGACASRPGMPHPAILGRRLRMPVINLGFSGNGRMELEVGQFLCELNAAVYVIDCLPNMQGPKVAERTVPLVRQLREARPETPILLVEDRTYSNAAFIPAKQQRHAAARAALSTAYDQLVDAGTDGLYYMEGEGLLGDDSDDTVDGSHPSDLGFYRQANAMEPVLREVLKLETS